jgi:hypothetical protein
MPIMRLTTKKGIREIFGRRLEDDKKYGKLIPRDYIARMTQTLPHKLIAKIRRLKKEKRKKYTST